MGHRATEASTILTNFLGLSKTLDSADSGAPRPAKSVGCFRHFGSATSLVRALCGCRWILDWRGILAHLDETRRGSTSRGAFGLQRRTSAQQCTTRFGGWSQIAPATGGTQMSVRLMPPTTVGWSRTAPSAPAVADDVAGLTFAATYERLNIGGEPQRREPVCGSALMLRVDSDANATVSVSTSHPRSEGRQRHERLHQVRDPRMSRRSSSQGLRVERGPLAVPWPCRIGTATARRITPATAGNAATMTGRIRYGPGIFGQACWRSRRLERRGYGNHGQWALRFCFGVPLGALRIPSTNLRSGGSEVGSTGVIALSCEAGLQFMAEETDVLSSVREARPAT